MKGIGLLIATLFAFSVARLLGATAWGEFSLALSLVTCGSIIGAAGFDTLLLKETSALKHTLSISQIYRLTSRITIVLSLTIAGLLFIFASFIATTLFQNPTLTLSFQIASFAIPAFTCINIHAGILQGRKQLKKYVFIRFVSHHAGGLILFLALFWFLSDFYIVTLAYTLSLWLVAAISYMWVRNDGDLLSQEEIPLSSQQKLQPATVIREAAPFMVAALLFFMKGWIDTIMIGVFLDEMYVGVYHITLKLTTLLAIALSAVSAVSTPLFSSAYSSGDTESLRSHVHQSSAIIFFTSLPIFLILVIFPEQILSLFGDEFTIGKTSLIILAIGGLFNTYFGTAGYFMQMTGSQTTLQYITLATVIAGIILNVLLIPVFGISGAATAATISIAGWNISCAIYIRKKYAVNVFYIPNNN